MKVLQVINSYGDWDNVLCEGEYLTEKKARFVTLKEADKLSEKIKRESLASDKEWNSRSLWSKLFGRRK